MQRSKNLRKHVKNNEEVKETKKQRKETQKQVNHVKAAKNKASKQDSHGRTESRKQI